MSQTLITGLNLQKGRTGWDHIAGATEDTPYRSVTGRLEFENRLVAFEFGDLFALRN